MAQARVVGPRFERGPRLGFGGGIEPGERDLPGAAQVKGRGEPFNDSRGGPSGAVLDDFTGMGAVVRGQGGQGGLVDAQNVIECALRGVDAFGGAGDAFEDQEARFIGAHRQAEAGVAAVALVFEKGTALAGIRVPPPRLAVRGAQPGAHVNRNGLEVAYEIDVGFRGAAVRERQAVVGSQTRAHQVDVEVGGDRLPQDLQERIEGRAAPIERVGAAHDEFEPPRAACSTGL